MQKCVGFWGDQGRVGRIRQGVRRGNFVFIYPDSRQGWWVVVVDEPDSALPHEEYVDDTAYVAELLEFWSVAWLPRDAGEAEVERRVFGWRPLLGHSWLHDAAGTDSEADCSESP